MMSDRYYEQAQAAFLDGVVALGWGCQREGPFGRGDVVAYWGLGGYGVKDIRWAVVAGVVDDQLIVQGGPHRETINAVDVIGAMRPLPPQERPRSGGAWSGAT